MSIDSKASINRPIPGKAKPKTSSTAYIIIVLIIVITKMMQFLRHAQLGNRYTPSHYHTKPKL